MKCMLVYLLCSGCLSVICWAADDPTDEEINKTMGPNEETVAMGGPTLIVRIEDENVRLGKEAMCYLELHNKTDRNMYIYVPSFRLKIEFAGPDGKYRWPDYGPGSYMDAQKDYVMLRPGSYYGVRYKCTPSAPGSIIFTGTYNNKEDGHRDGLAVWTGTAEEAKSLTVQVIAEP